MVYRFLTVAVGPVEADDCFQETFLSALRAYPRLRDGEHLDRWVLRIASRKAIDAHRKRSRRPVPASEVEALADLAATATAPAGLTEVAAEELWSAVGKLPPRQRVAVVHRHVLDRPYREIGQIMGCTEEGARANVYQGMKRLREELA